MEHEQRPTETRRVESTAEDRGMTTERWRRIDVLYHELLARPVHERAAALVAACPGDAALQAEVQSLLDQPEPDAGFLVTPALDVAARLVSPGSSLFTGRRIGVFEVHGLLGVGGMGEVYRARDTGLGREVAIKILPRAFKDHPDRLARFEREARALASLNHPHIGAIYGLQDADGVNALVMELVEGEDLSQRIARGAIPIDDVLAIARQIAEALETTHEQGIIHRDLKPANIKVRRDGRVKVLHFGLAKGLAPASDAAPMVTTIPTQAGAILGTPAYMSPEQARGEAASPQADIWAFGVVLYELLTGASPFGRRTTADTLASVLGTQPDYSVLPSDTPANVRHLVRRCLVKDRKRRLQHMGDVRIEIEEALAAPSVEAAPGPAEGQSALPPRLRFGNLPWIAAAAVMTAVAVVALWAPWRSTQRVDRPMVRLDVDLGADVSLPPVSSNASAAGSSVAISADGMRLVYASGTPPKLFTRRLDQPKATELAGTLGAVAPFFSPDGQWIGFLVNNKLYKISVEGGTIVPLPLGDAGFTVGGASWGEDGHILVGTQRGLVRIQDGGGQPETVAALADGEVALAFPQILPGGRAALFSAYTAANSDASSIEVMTLADHHRKTVSRGGTSPRYLATSNGEGYLLYINKRHCSRSNSTWTSWKRAGRRCPLWTTSPSTRRRARLN